ncbi:DUF3106 domain-containing protein [Desulfobacterales bacterium HSG17]|nr:DUF3106 domain-containing protein [Desulfobacterales bacterium HSG17]
MNIKYNISYSLKSLLFLILLSISFSGNAIAKSNDLYSEENFHHIAFLTASNNSDFNKKLKEWKSLSPEKKKKLRQKMQELEKMPPEARKLYQQRFRQWKKLPPAEQNSIRNKLKNWNNLSPREKEAIRRRFKD